MSVATLPEPNQSIEQIRSEWVERVTNLVSQIEAWATEFGWSVRRLDKPLEESDLGPYTVPGLVLQDGWVRVMLEPIARSVPGADGVVDLYRMPAYDDIASLYLRRDDWFIRRADREEPVVLTKGSLGVLLAELTGRGA